MNKLFLLFFGIPFFIFSQNSGKIIYAGNVSFKDLEFKQDSMYNEQKEMLKNLLNSGKARSYKLLFNKTESIFSKNIDLNNDTKGINITDIMGSKGEIYTNSKSKKILKQKEAYGELFLIYSNLDSIKWEIKNETKEIGKYKCYKAISTIRLKNSKGYFFRKIEAWFTNKIPYSFGPNGFGNLPGIILELKYGRFKYTASKIILSNDKITIKIPKKGKKITQEGFDKFGANLMKSLSN